MVSFSTFSMIFFFFTFAVPSVRKSGLWLLGNAENRNGDKIQFTFFKLQSFGVFFFCDVQKKYVFFVASNNYFFTMVVFCVCVENSICFVGQTLMSCGLKDHKSIAAHWFRNKIVGVFFFECIRI